MPGATPTSSVTSVAELPRFKGTLALIWYKPTSPGAKPAKVTWTVRPPTFTTGVMAAIESGLEAPAWPEATAGRTAPRPVAKIVMVSPGEIGFVALIGTPNFNTEKIPGS